MVIISDEMIMALVDGELNTEQAAIVQQAMENNSELRKKADLFSATTLILQGLYDAPLHEEVPRHLLTRIYSPGKGNRITHAMKKKKRDRKP